MPKYYGTCYGIDRKYGAWFFRIVGYGLFLYAPWKPALFSERTGRIKTIKLKNWRIGLLKP